MDDLATAAVESPADIRGVIERSPLRKELRLGLVCYGGVSLAVYMHGITVELQRLVCTSMVFDQDPFRLNPFPPDSTEHVYWKALSRMMGNGRGDGAALRVIVDVIAGTSAGGINGIVLAKALARGLKQDPLREIWFEKASLLKLLLRLPRLFGRKPDEVRLRAPLSGRRMSGWAYAALQEMNRQPMDGSARGLPQIPDGNELDLFVTATDCAGFRRTIDLHDPEAIHDMEYRHVLHFHYDPQVDPTQAFGEGDDPVLTFAVRSTSSFPGAFPPVTISEVEAVAGRPFTSDELERHFSSYFLEEAEPKQSFFLDGGVLNNRPFDHAVRKIMERTADRQVERRLLFIEPHPVDTTPERTKPPGWFDAIRAATLGIPSHQPIVDALTELSRHNMRALEIQQMIVLTEPKIFDLIQSIGNQVDKLQGSRAGDLATLTLEEIEEWAGVVGQKAQQIAGPSYPAYEAIKISEVLADLSTGLCDLLGYPAASRHAALVGRMVRRWAVLRHFVLEDGQEAQSVATHMEDKHAQDRVAFLKVFDLNFRRRRLRFLIRRINEAYSAVGREEVTLRPRLDLVKKRLYALIRQLRSLQSGNWIRAPEQTTLHESLDQLFGRKALAPLLAIVAQAEERDVTARPVNARLDNYLRVHFPALTETFGRLGDQVKLQLAEFRKAQSAELGLLVHQSGLPRQLLQQLLERYVGYAHWDAVLYPLIAVSRLTEPDPVEVIRVSSNDTKLLSPAGVEGRLKGIGAKHFGAFLKKSYRENDFLWGRLDAVERLLNMLADVEIPGGPPGRSDGLIWEGFGAVLAAETATMTTSQARQTAAKLSAEVKRALDKRRGSL